MQQARSRPEDEDGLPNSERVYRMLKQMIVMGELPPQTRLVELQLASRFGVSRTPVREALKRLTADRLVRNDPVRGLVVHELEPEEVQEVYIVREALNSLAARLAAPRITQEQVTRLNAILTSMEDAVRVGRTDLVVNANIAFHDVIYRAAANRTLMLLAKDLNDYTRRFSTEAFASPERVVDVVQEHRAILDALELHDPAAAQAASTTHLKTASGYLTQLHVDRAVQGLSAGMTSAPAGARR